MRFTESPEINLPVGNSTLSFQQDNSTLHVGTSVWPCSLVLVKFAERWSEVDPKSNPYSSLLDFKNKRAIEIGAGCGVAAMGFYLLGLQDIVVTDIPAVMPALKHNLKRNKPILGKNLKTVCLNWSNSEQIRAVKPPFNVVIAADVVYIEEAVGPLVGAMMELMGDHGVVMLGYQVRSPEADLLFWQMCGRVFEVEKVPHEHLHPDYAYEELDVYIFRKKLQK